MLIAGIGLYVSNQKQDEKAAAQEKSKYESTMMTIHMQQEDAVLALSNARLERDIARLKGLSTKEADKKVEAGQSRIQIMDQADRDTAYIERGLKELK